MKQFEGVLLAMSVVATMPSALNAWMFFGSSQPAWPAGGLSPWFVLWAFTPWMSGVWPLRGETPVPRQSWSDLTPAAVPPLNNTVEVLTTDAESLARTNEPCKPGFFFSRYFESPLFTR